MPSQAVMDKAAKLLRDDRIHMRKNSAVYDVNSLSGNTYTVIVWHERKKGWIARCLDCEAGKAEKICNHLLATLKYHLDHLPKGK